MPTHSTMVISLKETSYHNYHFYQCISLTLKSQLIKINRKIRSEEHAEQSLSPPKWQGRWDALPPCTRLPVPRKPPEAASSSSLSSSNQFRLLGFQKLPKACSWWSALHSQVSKACSHTVINLMPVNHTVSGADEFKLTSGQLVYTRPLFFANASTIFLK